MTTIMMMSMPTHLSDQSGGRSLSFGFDHDLLLLLHRALHNVLGSLRLLLCDLLGLHSRRVLLRECEVSDRHIVYHDKEVQRSAHEQVADTLRHQLSLRQQLRGIVLSNDSLGDLVHNGWQHALIKV